MNCYYQIDGINSFQPSFHYYLPLMSMSQHINYDSYSQNLFPFQPVISPENYTYSLVSVEDGHREPSTFSQSYTSTTSKNSMQANQPNELRPQGVIKRRKDKTAQKESRNVLSNLLRILFKNILEVKAYEELILRIIEVNRFNTDEVKFYTWLGSFGVNYRNYIKYSSVKRIFTSKKRKDHLAIFRIVVQQYTKILGITHCLSSKRIENESIKMHL